MSRGSIAAKQATKRRTAKKRDSLDRYMRRHASRKRRQRTRYYRPTMVEVVDFAKAMKIQFNTFNWPVEPPHEQEKREAQQA